MKRSVYIACVLLSSAALAGCVRSEDAGTIATAKSHVSLTAGIETRTDISDPNSPVWSAGDAIGVHFVGGDEINHHRLESTSADGGRTATFEGDVTLDAGDYTIYGYYPHGEAGGLTAHHQTAKIEIPSVQRPTATSFDPAADIMVMWPINHSHNGTDITHAGLQFKRVLGMLKFVLTAPELNGEAISELTFTTDAGLELAGMGHFDLTDGTFLEFYDGAATSVTALPAGVHADGTDAIMLCVPVMTIGTGVEMTITGETESFTFEKSLTVADPIQLQPGGWHTMNITLSGTDITPKEAGAVEINGVLWAENNVGMPEAFADTPGSVGLYYQWNRAIGWTSTNSLPPTLTAYVEGGIVVPMAWPSSNSSGAVWAEEYDPCPEGWRIPSVADFTALCNDGSVTRQWQSASGGSVAGMKFTDKVSGKSIFLPAGGWLTNNNGRLLYQGQNCDYWTSEPRTGTSQPYGYKLSADNSGYANPAGSVLTAYGCNIRCVKK